MKLIGIPNVKIPIGHSVDGFLVGGAVECAKNAINAHRRMVELGYLRGDPFFNRLISAKEMRDNPDVRNSEVVKGFLALRPYVANAEHYLAVLQTIEEQPDFAREIPWANCTKELFDQFNKRNGSGKEKGTDSYVFNKFFYVERDYDTRVNTNDWLSIQSFYKDTVAQLRLVNRRKREIDLGDGKKDFVGFDNYYVTSKNKESVIQLCNVASDFKVLNKGEYRSEIIGIDFDERKDWALYFEQLMTCLISPEKIIAREDAGNDKESQIKLMMQKAGVPAEQVIRTNDRYDKDEYGMLKRLGAHYVVVTGGYVFPKSYDEARDNGITVINRSNFDAEIWQFAQKLGF